MHGRFPKGSMLSSASKILIISSLAMWLAIVLNIPLLRQVLGFFYISFIPGLVILKSLKINQRSVIHIVLFSVGLSLAFVMFLGLLLNSILPYIGFSRPLNTFNLIISVTILEFILLFAGRLNSSRSSLFEKPKLVASKSFLFIVSIPICSAVGAIIVQYYASNLLLLFTFIMICVLFLLTTFGKIPPRLYPLVVVAIALALLFQNTLANRYLNGWDIHIEYYLAQVTKNSQFWNPSLVSASSSVFTFAQVNNYNTMLSITILPTIFSNVLNLNVFYVYTVIYPLLFSLVPLALYQVFEGQFNSRIAFWSVFLFMSFSAFYVDMTYLARQMIAEIFFVLIFLLLFDRGTKRNSGINQVMLIAFAFGTVVSHYATTFICIVYLIFFCMVLEKSSKERSVRLYLLLFATIAFSWYVFVSNSTSLFSLVATAKNVIAGLQNYFVSLSSSPIVAIALGPVSTSSLVARIVSQISRILFISITLLIVIGVLKTFFVRRNVTFSKKFLFVSIPGVLLMLALVLLPNFQHGLTKTRTYEFGLVFTAPFMVVGSEFIFRYATRLKRSLSKIRWIRYSSTHIRIGSILMSALLITYFLFQTGVVNEVTGAIPTSLSLTIDKGRLVKMNSLALYDAFTLEEDVFGARWLSNHTTFPAPLSSARILFNAGENSVLISYGMINPNNIELLTNDTVIPKNSLIYLYSLNVIYGLSLDSIGTPHNMTELSNSLGLTDIVYSNGKSEVLWSPVDFSPIHGPD